MKGETLVKRIINLSTLTKVVVMSPNHDKLWEIGSVKKSWVKDGKWIKRVVTIILKDKDNTLISKRTKRTNRPYLFFKTNKSA